MTEQVPSLHCSFAGLIAAMASRRGLRLLALLAIAALLLLVQGAAAAKEDTAVTDATAAEQETALTKKKAAADDTAAGAKGAKSPPPPPAKKKKKQEDPAAAAATGTTTADKSPAKSPSPSPAPSPSPSPAPAPVAAPAPPPQPTYCPDGAGCQTIKLVFKIAGAPDPLSGSDVQVWRWDWAIAACLLCDAVAAWGLPALCLCAPTAMPCCPLPPFLRAECDGCSEQPDCTGGVRVPYAAARRTRKGACAGHR